MIVTALRSVRPTSRSDWTTSHQSATVLTRRNGTMLTRRNGTTPTHRNATMLTRQNATMPTRPSGTMPTRRSAMRIKASAIWSRLATRAAAMAEARAEMSRAESIRAEPTRPSHCLRIDIRQATTEAPPAVSMNAIHATAPASHAIWKPPRPALASVQLFPARARGWPQLINRLA